MSVRFERDGHVGIITIDRPEAANAINRDVRRGLREAFATLKADDDLWVGVVTASGRNFCSGADLREMGDDLESGRPDGFQGQDYLGDFETDMTMRKPLVAAINGPCIGMGFTIALSCDFRIASETAYFSYPEARWGLPTVVGTVRIPRFVSLTDAMEIMLLGDAVPAARAEELRLVNRVVPAGQALEEGLALALRLCQNAPLAVYAMKELMLRSYDLPFGDAIRLGEGLRSAIRNSEDFREGLLSFREKRPAEFQGR